MNYLWIKHLHITAVTLSITLFCLRGWWMFTASPWLQRRWVKWVPHLIDTILLSAGVTLAILARQYPFVHGWLTPKVLALIVYIVLGSIALKRGPTRRARAVAFVAALATFGYIVHTALTKSPLPLLTG